MKPDLSFDETKEILEMYHDKYNRKEFIENDPISIPHLFNKKEDIEIAGFFAAVFAWGQRRTIINKSKDLLNRMDNTPFDFICNHSSSDLKHFDSFTHRTFNGDDCKYFMKTLKKIYTQHGGLEFALIGEHGNNKSLESQLINFRKMFFKGTHLSRTEKHLSSPESQSACKRINMFLRWMVRKDNRDVDFGLWKGIQPSSLFCPLDVHSGRMARHFGLLKRTQNDWKSVVELSSNLRLFDAADPAKYDFSLFGSGIDNKEEV